MKVNNPQELSGFMRQQRKNQQRSQGNVAVRIGRQQQTISAFERNSTQAQIDTLFRIVHELDLELHLLHKDDATSHEQWTEEW